jgi:urease accessory protein
MSLYAIGREGELRLTFERHEDKTVLSQNYSRPPLQVMRAIRDEAGCLCVYLLSPTGGVVQHDRYRINLTLEDGAHALFTTQSATKIYRMPDGCAEQWVQIEVGRGALLEYVPDAAILFAEADFHQRTEVTLAAGGVALLTDVIMPGRLARGERLQFRRFANRFVVRDEAGLIAFESSVMQPALTDFDALGRLDGFSCWGTAYIVGDIAGRGGDFQRFALNFHSRLADLLPAKDGIGGISLLHRGGLSVRVLSHRLETIYTVFHALRDHLRTTIHIPVTPLRK